MVRRCLVTHENNHIIILYLFGMIWYEVSLVEPWFIFSEDVVKPQIPKAAPNKPDMPLRPIKRLQTKTVRGAVASLLVRLTPERALRVRALAGDIVLCSWARHFTLTVPLSTQVYKWVLANLMLGVTLRLTSIPSRGSRNSPSRFMLQKPG